jgi:tRNA-2-methylthio-N6-dimethylallyladenosine synthase
MMDALAQAADQTTERAESLQMKGRRQPRTFFIRTYGCQMNENDSEIMVGALKKRGLVRTEEEQEADLLIFNTCSVRDLAERKVMGKVGRLGLSKRPSQIIGITGCMANAKKESLFRKLPAIDFVLGTNNIHELDGVLDEIMESGRPACRTDDEFTQDLDYVSAERSDPVKASVSIIRGCDKYCTYCVVPYTRGPEVSRSPESILEECKRLVDQGYREITLLGQNVNSYGKDQPEWNCRFHDLLAKIDALPGLAHLRFMTSHPVDITKELMEAIRDLPTLCEFVHFPLQAGADRVLKKMHRIYTVEQYLEKVSMLRQIVPNVTLGTDIIVGFPTETDEEFEETYRLMEQIRFSVAFLFAYSPRKGTPAMRWRDDVPEEVKQARLQRLLDLHARICAEQRQELLGTTMPVLLERASERNPGMMKGRTRCWKNVLVPSEVDRSGQLVQVHMTSFAHQTLIGELRDAIAPPFYAGR